MTLGKYPIWKSLSTRASAKLESPGGCDCILYISPNAEKPSEMSWCQRTEISRYSISPNSNRFKGSLLLTYSVPYRGLLEHITWNLEDTKFYFSMKAMSWTDSSCNIAHDKTGLIKHHQPRKVTLWVMHTDDDSLAAQTKHTDLCHTCKGQEKRKNSTLVYPNTY